MNGNLGSGLVLIALGAGIFVGWWSGAFETLLGDVTGRIRAPGAGIAPAAAAPAVPSSSPFAVPLMAPAAPQLPQRAV